MKKGFYLGVGLIGVSSLLRAQGGQEQVMTSLSFDQAVKLALKDNVALNQARNLRYASEIDRRAAVASMGPRLSSTVQGWKTRGNQFIETEGRVVNGAETNNLQVGLNASVVLFGGLRQQNTLRLANRQLEAQESGVKRTTQDVIANVALQFLQCLLDQEILRIRREDNASKGQQLEQIRAFVATGMRAPVEEYNQLALVKASDLEVTRAEYALRNDKAELAQTLQLDPSINFNLEEPAWPVDTLGPDPAALQMMYETALQSRSDYQRLLRQEESAKFAESISRASKLPELAAFASFGSFYTNASLPSIPDQFDANSRLQYGLQLTIPIFNGLQNHTRVVRAMMTYENTRLDRQNLERQVKRDVIQAFQNYRDVVKNFNSATAQWHAAEQALQYEAERYRLGIITLVEFTVTNEAFVRAETDVAQASYSLLFQQMLLDYALGTLQFDEAP